MQVRAFVRAAWRQYGYLRATWRSEGIRTEQSIRQMLCNVPRGTAFFLLLIFISPCHLAVEVSVTLTPNEDVYVLRDATNSVTFNCKVNGTDLVAWLVNDTSSADSSIRNRGVTTTAASEIANSGVFTSSLNITSNIINDNTRIQCQAIVIDELVLINSTAVLFHVRDTPGPPYITVINSDGLNRILEWSAPGTDVLHYRVCYNITADSLKCANVTNTEFTFPNAGVNLLFTVSAVNGVGEGRNSSAIHKACDGMILIVSIPPFPQRAYTIMFWYLICS